MIGITTTPRQGIGISDITLPIKNTEEKSPLLPDYGHIPIGEAWYYLDLVGTGRTTKGQKYACRSVVPKAAACNNKPHKHKPVLIPHNCGRRTCPDCWTTWADRAADRGVDVLNGYITARYGSAQKALPGMEIDRMLPRHVSFHPPRQVIDALVREVDRVIVSPRDFQTEFLKRLRQLATRIIEEAGGVAGVMVPHEIRLKSDRDNQEADYTSNTNRYRKVLNRDDWQEHVKYYPHVHVLLFGSLENSKDFNERTGWTYRMHRVAHEPRDALYYLLSHASAAHGVNAVTYFGACAPRKLRKVHEYRCRVPLVCDECIKEGIDKEHAYRVLARVLPGSLVFENDQDQEKQLHRGRGEPVKWMFEGEPSSRHYVKVRKVGIYRIHKKGDGWQARGKPEYISEDYWQELQSKGVIPGSWFDRHDDEGKR